MSKLIKVEELKELKENRAIGIINSFNAVHKLIEITTVTGTMALEISHEKTVKINLTDYKIDKNQSTIDEMVFVLKENKKPLV